MQCKRPIKASFDVNGNITFVQRLASLEYASFAFPCRKCLPCMLNIAREKAIRCVHEADAYDDQNIFLTLTYADEHLKSTTLIYSDFQNFMKRLRKTQPQKIPVMVTGEYGEQTKRPHWHALLFNYRPRDQSYKYTSDRGDTVYNSEKLQSIWGNGNIEYGSLTLESAGYVARYAAKKLVHKDDQYLFSPIHKTSSKNAIGKSWIEKYYKQTFEHGYVTIDNIKMKIPRYYEDWLKKHHYDLWREYAFNLKLQIIRDVEEKNRKEELDFISQKMSHKQPWCMLTRKEVKLIVLERKFNNLCERLKL